MRIAGAPGVRRLARRSERPGEARENASDGDAEPHWCADCRREVLFDLSQCPDCGGTPVTALELGRLNGEGPRGASASPTGWRLPRPTSAGPNDVVVRNTERPGSPASPHPAAPA